MEGTDGGHQGTRVAGCFFTGLRGLLIGLGRIQNVLAKYRGSIVIVLNHLFKDTPWIRIGGVSEANRYLIRYPIRICWLAQVSVHSSMEQIQN